MGKKPVAKGKAKAGYSSSEAAKAPSEEELKEEAAKAEARRLWQQRKDGTKWAQAQLAALEAQREAAAKEGQDWPQAPHKFHESQLNRVVKTLEEKLLDGVPDSLKASVEAYVAQLAGGAAGKQEGFREERELYKDLELVEDPNAIYVREAASEEDAKLVQEISAWTDATEQGMKKFASLLIGRASSSHVQDAGLCRIGWLFTEHKDAEPGSSATSGLTAAVLMPAIEAGMKGCKKDPEVQRAGCAALRGLGQAEGQLAPLLEAGGAALITEALTIHLKIEDVCQTANAAVWNMSQKAGKNSPELAEIVKAGVVDALKKVMYHHAWNQTLVGKVRVTLPFLVET
eukprot:TRINITY_DN94284_c0_g1_i1.p1 TRINITY_DN94284_c0_g1~~TRINITY_DN94284_c0_g1_i1.p1  ORF type:complete len:344 (+),score=92.45 TRINITY_DN94284_c0_g1_i1:55-1086(+)